jgi:modulator of FtsH protease
MLDAIASWSDFFAAQLGASAALTGLLFVGVSINLGKILEGALLPLRAFMALVLLIVVLVLSSLLIMPGQSATAIGIEALAIGTALWAFGTAVEIRGWIHLPPQQHRVTYLGNAVLLQAATLPYMIGGILLLAGDPSAFYWLGVSVILSFVKAMIDSWVLLVEINR